MTRTSADFSPGEAVRVAVGGASVAGRVVGWIGAGRWRVDVAGIEVDVDAGALARVGGGALPAAVRAAILGAARGPRQAGVLRGRESWATNGGRGWTRATRAALLARIEAALPAPWFVALDYPPDLAIGDPGRALRLYASDGLGGGIDVAAEIGG